MEQKPNLFVIGSAKCGTTTVARVLGEHPDCCMSDPKEPAFFCDEDNFARGWSWYKTCWSQYDGQPVVAEATANYTDYPQHPDCAERIHAFNPDAKIVFIVRHPFDKLVSLYRHFWTQSIFNARSGFEPFLNYMCHERQFLEQCKYSSQLKRYQDVFPANQILVLFLENWKNDPKLHIEKLFEFAGLNPFSSASLTTLRENSANSHRIEKGWFTQMRRNPITRMLGRSLLPTRVRYWVGQTIGMTSSTSLPLVLSAKMTVEIINQVKPDADRFLQELEEESPSWDWASPPWRVSKFSDPQHKPQEAMNDK